MLERFLNQFEIDHRFCQTLAQCDYALAEFVEVMRVCEEAECDLTPTPTRPAA